ncbi:hypothetical protein FIBSPDRAFT_878272, partial [Athelia psychrophila]
MEPDAITTCGPDSLPARTLHTLSELLKQTAYLEQQQAFLLGDIVAGAQAPGLKSWMRHICWFQQGFYGHEKRATGIGPRVRGSHWHLSLLF